MADGIGNRILRFLKLEDQGDDYDDDFYDDDYDDEEELRKEEKRLQKEQRKNSRRSTPSYDDDDYYEEEEEDIQPVAPRKTNFRTTNSFSTKSKVVQMPTTSNGVMEVCIVRPNNIGESQQVCKLLMDNHPVVVNLEGIDVMEAQRIMDFISGCIFAISGNMCQISRYIFIFSPKDVEISGDYIKNLENEQSYNMASFHKEF